MASRVSAEVGPPVFPMILQARFRLSIRMAASWTCPSMNCNRAGSAYDSGMGREFSEIDEEIRGWIARQKIFFVSTAPMSGNGRVNVSPKGMDTFRVLGPRSVAYLDLTGSGVETIAHLRENGRITIMMCAFTGPPRIFRFYGRGEVYERGTEKYAECIPRFEELVGSRSIIHIEVDLIRDSCGYSIPLYDFRKDRDVLTKWADAKGEEDLVRYQQENNRESLDGLPGIGED